MMLSTFPPRSLTFSSLVTVTGGVPGGVIGLLDSANALERLERRESFLAVGQSRQDRAEHAIAHRLPVGPDRDHQVSAMLDPIYQRLALERVECLKHGAIVGVYHDAVGRVIAVPPARHDLSLGVDPLDHDLCSAGSRQRPLIPLTGLGETRQGGNLVNAHGLTERQDQLFVGHDRFRRLSHADPLRHLEHARALAVERA